MDVGFGSWPWDRLGSDVPTGGQGAPEGRQILGLLGQAGGLLGGLGGPGPD